ncbi:MAG: NADH-quinone oxidoreductase subunit NuoK [Coriobacteriia bacterium]|nr:NADH-quinone oxidoreductase subunit NuoK [Coriobacteriia bacterium]MCL2746861.1 NADH-quinone oxidoreductase subunit NuoK [Coriobacteriia bacterium]MCL2870598.1 NADH-quinone oxidoreductase subunit NuoK [Coriobacteriia bacterium]
MLVNFDSVGLVTVLLFAAALFSVGLYGAMTRKAAVSVLMSLEIMLFAISINIVALAQFIPGAQMYGWHFSLFLMVIGAAEIAIGLSLVVAIYRRIKTSDVEKLQVLKDHE